MSKSTPTKKPYQRPAVRTVRPERPAVLLLCTGQYNCVAEVGFDCCQPDATTCDACF